MKLTKEQQEFVTKNHNLILSYLGKHNLRYDDFYDVLSIALCKAAATFDSSRGVAFSTDAYKCFFNAVGSEIRKIKRQIGAEGNLIHITNENEDKISYDSVALNIDAAVDIKKIIDKYDINEYLTPKEKEAYEYLSKGYTQTEIAKTLGKSKQCVSINCRAAREKLIKLIKKDNNLEDLQIKFLRIKRLIKPLFFNAEYGMQNAELMVALLRNAL